MINEVSAANSRAFCDSQVFAHSVETLDPQTTFLRVGRNPVKNHSLTFFQNRVRGVVTLGHAAVFDMALAFAGGFRSIQFGV